MIKYIYMKKQIAVIGAGNMGTAMAELLAENGHPVNIWDIEYTIHSIS